jgi:hypothetical protein
MQCPGAVVAARGRPKEGPLDGTDFTRHDLAPEPVPQPDVSDVLEGIAAALEQAVDLVEAKRTAARCLTIQTRVQAAVNGHVTGDELLRSLDRLVQDWRS